MGEEKANACIEAGCRIRGGGGSEEAANQAQRLSTVAGGSKEGGDGLVC